MNEWQARVTNTITVEKKIGSCMFNDFVISNPFPGLRAFEVNEDILFFGREKQVDELLKKLSKTRFIAVIGSSGSGKSSLIKAGLIPALFRGRVSSAGSQWRICSFRPGNDPIHNMAVGLSQSGVLYNLQTQEDVETYTVINENILRRGNSGLATVYKQSGIDSKENLLVLVDQFEELFRFFKSEKEVKDGKHDSLAFINLLLKATEQRELPVYVVFTMRSDFLSDCTELSGLPEAINEGQYLVPRMRREERKQAIEAPISVAGAGIAPRLLNQLLNDIGDTPDQLPILQHALMRTWEVWRAKNTPDTAIDINDYEEIGGMRFSLSQHAEEAFAEISTDRQKYICEKLFKAIMDNGSETRGICRPIKLGEICVLANATLPEVLEVIDVFRKSGRGFLMPPDKVALTADSIIDVSHESIMRVWERLIGWVDEENESAQVYFRLCEAAVLYEEGRGGLWRDPELQVAWKWKVEQQPNETWASRYNNQFEKAILFLEHSKKQFELENKHKEELQKIRLRRASRVVIMVSVVALAAMFLSIYAFHLKNIATKQTTISVRKTAEAEHSRRLAEQQRKLADVSKEEALQEKQLAEKSKEVAIKQNEIANLAKIKAEQSRQEALVQKTKAEQQKINAEGQRVIAETKEKEAEVQRRNAEQQTIRALASEKAATNANKVSNTLKNLAECRTMAYESILLFNEKKIDSSKTKASAAYRLNAENNGPLQNADIFNALQFNWVNDIQFRNQFTMHKAPVRAIAVRPGANVVFTADESGVLYVSSVTENGWKPISVFEVKEPIRALAVSPDGRRLVALTSVGNGIMFNISSDNILSILSRFLFSGISKSVCFLGNDNLMITKNTGLIKSKISTAVTQESFVKGENISAAIVSKSGKIIIASGNTINVYENWEDIGLNVSDTYRINTRVMSLAIDESEYYLAAGTYEGVVWVKNIRNNSSPVNLALHLSSVNDLKFSKLNNGRLQLASGGADQLIKLVDVKSAFSEKKEDIITLKGHSKWIYGLNYLTNVQLLLSVSEDTKAIVWKPVMSDLYHFLNKK